jgi:hypothetical protein
LITEEWEYRLRDPTKKRYSGKRIDCTWRNWWFCSQPSGNAGE